MKKYLLLLLLNLLIYSNNHLLAQCNTIAINENYIYAGTSWGGIFLSTDNGVNWTAVNNGLTNLDVFTIAINGENIFAGTDEGGIFLSTNSGANWTTMNNGLTNLIINSIVIDGENVFAATGGGGVFLSTDKGQNWTAVNNGLKYLDVLSLAIESDTIFAGTRKLIDGKLFLSSNNGTSWTELADFIPLAIAPSNENIFVGTNNGIYLSTDNDTVWTLVNNGLTNFFTPSIARSGNKIFAATGGGIYLSTDIGANWNAVNDGLTDLTVNFISINGENIFAVTGGGIFLSSNSEINWDKIFDDHYYLTTNTGVVRLSISSDGLIGRKEGPGVGFTFMNSPNALYTGGIMIGNSNNHAVGTFIINDMVKTDKMPGFSSNNNFDEITQATFDDSNAPSPYGVKVKQYTYANTNNPYIYMVYEVKNESANTLDDFYIGIYIDWNIGGTDNNKGGYVQSDNLVYQYENPGGEDPNYYGIVALSGMSGAKVSPGGDRELIIDYMSSFLNDTISDVNDYRSFIGSGPFTIEPNGTQRGGFAILAGTDLNNLILNTLTAQQGWNSGIVSVEKDNDVIPSDYILLQNYPNPFNPSTTIVYQIPRQSFVSLKIYDLLGREIISLIDKEQIAGSYKINFNASNLTSGIYFYRLQADNFVETKKMILMK